MNNRSKRLNNASACNQTTAARDNTRTPGLVIQIGKKGFSVIHRGVDPRGYDGCGSHFHSQAG